jgi:hypothetical protein
MGRVGFRHPEDIPVRFIVIPGYPAWNGRARGFATREEALRWARMGVLTDGKTYNVYTYTDGKLEREEQICPPDNG